MELILVGTMAGFICGCEIRKAVIRRRVERRNTMRTEDTKLTRLSYKVCKKIYKKIHTNEDCNICFGEIKNGIEIKCCRNYFHNYCFKDWKKHNNSCPLCRKKKPSYTKIIYEEK
jgi:hypothetical protein